MTCKHLFEQIGTIGSVPVFRCELLQMPCAEYREWKCSRQVVDRSVPQPGQAHEVVQVCSECTFWESKNAKHQY